MSLQTFSSFPGGAINAHIADELLMIAKKNVVFQQLGEKAKLPPGESKTFQFNRYERLSLPLVTLTEGTPPSSTNMSLTTVSAVSDQWGAFIALSDVAQLTIKHPLLSVAIELLGYQAAELLDREIIAVLQGSLNVIYGGAATTRAGLSTAATDSFTDLIAQKVVAALRARGAYPYESQNYVGVIDPYMEQDVTQSTNSAFLYASAYSNVKALFNGEIGMWRGVRWMTSNLLEPITGFAAVTATSASSPVGTFTTANYRVEVSYYDAVTGFIVGHSQNANVAMTSTNSLALTTPNNNAYNYKIFVSAAAAAATAIMFQGVETTFGTALIPFNTACSVLAPPTTGASISGSNIPQTGVVVHQGWVFGKQAYCTVDLMNLQTFVSAPQATISDPLVQQRTVGYKLMFKAVIQNDAFMQRIEVMSQFL